MIEALQQSHDKLSSQVRRLEVERVKQMALIDKLKDHIPPHLLKQLQAPSNSTEDSAATMTTSVPTITYDLASNTSTTDNSTSNGVV